MQNRVRTASSQSFDPLGLAEEEEQMTWMHGKNFSRVLVMIAAALYGTNFATVKILDDQIPIAAGASLRFTLAALAVSPFLFSKSKTDGSSLSVILAGLEIGAWNSAGYLSQAVGLASTSASKSAFICSLAVVIVPLLDFVFRGKKLNEKSLIGCVLAVVGVALLEVGDVGEMSFGSGDLATFFQPLAFGVGFWRMERAMSQHSSEALKLTAAQLLAVASVSTVYMLLGGGDTPPPSLSMIQTWLSTPSILGSLVWTGVITTAFTVFLETLALKNLSAAETTLLFSTEPIWGSLFASVVMGEVFGPQGFAGAGVILFSCLYSSGGLDALFTSKEKKFSELPQTPSPSQRDQLLTTTPSSLVTTGGGLVATTVVSDLQSNIDLDGSMAGIESLEATIADEVASVAASLHIAEITIKALPDPFS